MAELADGTVTFLFTDIESSSQLWEQYPDGMNAALACHDLLLRQAIEAHQGTVVKTTGDGILAAFRAVASALAAALSAQQALFAETWLDIQP
jgi:class 3 adenylate cyclase